VAPAPTEQAAPAPAAQTAETTPIEDLATVLPIEPLSRPPIAGPDDLATVKSGPQDIWTRIRMQFALPDWEHDRVRSNINWYAGHPAYITRTFERARPFLFHIVEEIEKRGMPMEIALLPVVESAFQPFAYSHGRASGIWQFIPGTGMRYGLKISWWYDGRRDVPHATRAALDYLSDLHKRFDGDWLLALAAYNSGGGTVSRAIRRNKEAGKPTDFWSLDLPRETEGYVPRLLAISHVVRDPAEHGVKLPPIPDTPQVVQIDVGSQIDIARAAELAGLTIADMYNLNPGINRWATDPDGPHTLVVPIDRALAFQQKLAALPEDERIEWARHRIKNGETLIHIARKYNTSPTVIRDVNNLGGSLIRAGDHLVIPVAQKSNAAYTLSADARLKQTQNTAAGSKKLTHTVSSGDTLWGLSRKYNVNVRSLASWNGMATRDTLRIGQKLVIWQSGNKTTLTRSALPQHKPQKIRYTVRRGDSLARIARKFSVTISSLKDWNKSSLANKKYLQPGQRLTLYVDITRTAENI
jgi:membrane-bound lytic murein transglycosylase D